MFIGFLGLDYSLGSLLLYIILLVIVCILGVYIYSYCS